MKKRSLKWTCRRRRIMSTRKAFNLLKINDLNAERENGILLCVIHKNHPVYALNWALNDLKCIKNALY